MKFLIVTYNKLPQGDAGAIRDNNFANLLTACENEVIIISMGKNDYKIKGVKHFSANIEAKSFTERLKKYYYFKKRVKEIINEYDILKNLDYIWIVDLPVNSVRFIKKISKRNNIGLIHDSVEWYSPGQFKLGFLSPQFLKKELYNRCIIDKNFKVIAISDYLKEYYLKKRIEVIRIPIIGDTNHIEQFKNDLLIKENKIIESIPKLKLMYAGSPGTKDYLKQMLLGLSLLSTKQLDRINFHIYGVNYNQIKKIMKKNLKELNKIEKSLSVYGRVNREEILKMYKSIDFTLLLRNSDKRYAKAGFPSKVVESLSNGVPVICNISSDMNQFLIHEVNSIIVTSESNIDFHQSLLKALNLSEERKREMKEMSLITFERNFNNNLYKYDLLNFLFKR